MSGMLATAKATGGRRFREWYVDMARRNVSYDMDRIGFVHWMDWLIVEAEKMSGDRHLLDVLESNTRRPLSRDRIDGAAANPMSPPWSKWPTAWERLYDAKCIVAYVPVLTARLRAVSAG